ncbi:MAG TPA: type II toxin-antitoxin system PemK/MazF family toxin [Acidimicrobiales bacterium]|jgi:mRNA interferase MazF|nr:type II toxin-antitoxin system PemK/MazF family toxin [Acidimicrobiales bacterium]
MGSINLIWRAEIYEVDLGAPVGHEPADVRPGLIVSADLINNGSGALVGVVPITSRDYGLRSHVELQSDPTGLDHDSYARCDQLRLLSSRRLRGLLGQASAESMDSIDRALRFMLDP